MNTLSLLLAWRYLRGANKAQQLSLMTSISFLGIFIGTAALALVVSVMRGFEHVTHTKMQSIHPAVMVAPNTKQYDDGQKIASILEELASIEHASPSIFKQVMINSAKVTENTIITLKAVDPLKEPLVSSIATMLILGDSQKNLPTLDAHAAFSQALANNQIIVGQTLANQLGVGIGDTVTLSFAKKQKVRGKKINLDNAPFIIGGLFKTGIIDFDNSLVFVAHSTFHDLFPYEKTPPIIGARLKSEGHEQEALEIIKKRFQSCSVYSWKELYPALVSALKLEKYVMFFIFALIALVASLNVISLLCMHITYKRSDIALLKALGMPDKEIRSIFRTLGMIICVSGALSGLCCAWLIGLLLQKYPFIKLPDAYCATYLPVQLEVSLFIAVFAVVCALGLFSCWWATKQLQSFKVTQALRFDR